MNTLNFTQHFEIIYNKFLKTVGADGTEQPSKAGLARYLGVNHGKMQAWEKGQWPSAADLANIETKFGFNLRWLVTGEGSPEGREEEKERPTHEKGAEWEEIARLKEQLAELQSVNIQLVNTLKDTVQELKAAQNEAIGWQREFLILQRQSLGTDAPLPSVTASPARGVHTPTPGSDEESQTVTKG